MVAPLFARSEMRFRLWGCWHGGGLSMRLEWFVSELVVLSSSKDASWWTVWHLPHQKWLQNFAFSSELTCPKANTEDGKNMEYLLDSIHFAGLQISSTLPWTPSCLKPEHLFRIGWYLRHLATLAATAATSIALWKTQFTASDVNYQKMMKIGLSSSLDGL